jgi:hypothetical protein
MDSDVQFYLERFRREEESLAEAHRMKVEWTGKESRHQNNMQALLQLLVDRALEAKQPLPEDIIGKATGLSGSHALKAISGTSETPNSEGERPTDGDGNDAPAIRPAENGASEQSRVDWIAGAVAASGTMGITPPEILAQAEKAGVSMHPNYPYVVLKKLVGKKRVRRSGARYYSAE